jgi:excisionase family DNA binding protein
MSKENQLLTAHQLAESLNLTVDTIWRYTREKKIPHVKWGNAQYRYQLEDVLRALECSEVREERAEYKPDREKFYTYDDYLKLPEEPGYRFEVLEGMLIKEPSPNVMHQRVSRRLQRILEDYFWQVDDHGEIFNAPLDVTFADTTVVQPDLFYVSGEQHDIVQDIRVDGAPTLVVEVLSPSSGRKDRMQKLRIYQKVQVPHYWLVDPENKTFECFALQNDIYALIASGMDDDVVEHPEFKGLSIALKELWSPHPQRSQR